MMKKRFLGITLAAAMVAGSLAAPVYAADTDYALTDAKFDDVKLKLYTTLNDSNLGYFQTKIDEFNEMDNGITVEINNISAEADYIDKLSTDFASGDTPNVFIEYGGARCLDYLEAGTLLDLQPYYDADPDWYGSFMDSSWEPADFTNYGYEGLYCMPFLNYQVVLFYNKDILAENNIEVPTTWDELQAACATLKENDVQPFIVGEKDNYRFGHLHTVLSLKTYGPEIGDKLGSREISYDGEEMTTVYNMIKEMIDNGYLGDNLLSTDAEQEASYFTEGQAAFQFNGTWGVTSIANSGSDLYTNQTIGVAQFPSVNEEYAGVDMGGANDSYFVSTLNKSEDEINASVVLLKYMSSQEFTKGLLEVSPNTMAIKTDFESDNYLLNDVNEIMANTETTRGDLQNYDSQSHMINTVRAALQGLAMGNSAEEVGAEIVDTMSQYE